MESDNPIPTDTMMSSQYNTNSSNLNLASDGAPLPTQRRPNPLSLNLLNDDIPKVIDLMATEVRASFQEFLSTFTEVDDDGEERYPYLDLIRSLRPHDKTTVYVDLQHILTANETLHDVITSQYYRY